MIPLDVGGSFGPGLQVVVIILATWSKGPNELSTWRGIMRHLRQRWAG